MKSVLPPSCPMEALLRVITGPWTIYILWVLSEQGPQRFGAIKRLVQDGGAQLRPFSPEIMEACYKAATDLYAEIAGTNANFKKVHDAYMAFRNEEYLWFQIGEYTYDSFMIRQRAKG